MTSDQKVEFLKARTEAGENAKTPTKNVFPYPLALSKEKEVDLSKCPQKVVQHREGQYTDHDYVTLGDLHGNSAKLIYFLVKEGIATFEPAENCQKTLDYYYSEKATHFPLDPEMVTLIDSIKIKKSPEVPNVRLIGDELSDRGRNDGITIEILKKISASQPRFEIMVSNHGVDFLGKIVGIEGPMSLDGNFTRSFTPLIEALKKKEKDKRDRDALRDLALFVKDVYLKHLKLVSATPQKESGPVVYTHAPTEPSLVYRAMVSLGLGIGSCKSPGDVEQNILLCSQRLNNKYRELLTEMLIKPDHANNVLQPVFNLKKESSNGKSRKHPLEELYWRRHEDWKKARRTGSWLTANGHDDGTGSTFGLDNYLGKDDSPLGIYQVLRPVVPKTIE